ncbi:MAG TPA: hypothetical protein VLC07_06570 [Solirubrobacterales bacterium]|nr:hypothetical protein [Solirubrobacterales bacterium]
MICRRALGAAIAAGILCLGIAGCGSSSSSTSTGTESEQSNVAAAPKAPAGTTRSEKNGGQDGGGGSGQTQAGHPRSAPPEPSFKPHPHHDSGGGARQFEVKGGDNSVQEFGGESSGSEFEEAATALHDYLDARAERAWAAACRYLAAGVTAELSSQLGEARGGSGPSCAELLAGLSGGVPESALREAAIANVGSLRVEGDRGFLLFHGVGQTDYFIPMVHEDGHWKVAAIAASAAP